MKNAVSRCRSYPGYVAGRSNGHGPKNTYRSRGECALVIQMACTHSAAMAVFNRVGGAAGDRTVSAMASAAARLLRAYATQVEAAPEERRLSDPPRRACAC